ncbi:MAG: MerR family transcriptional regulator [Actinomycetota bacterium]
MGDSPAMTIGEAARVTGVGIHTLRYYEKQDLLRVPRTANGQRRFGPSELASVRFIAQLRKTGMPIGTIREYAEMVRSGTATADASLQLLENHRDDVLRHLDEQKRYLTAIRLKIAAYRAEIQPDEPAGDGAPT